MTRYWDYCARLYRSMGSDQKVEYVNAVNGCWEQAPWSWSSVGAFEMFPVQETDLQEIIESGFLDDPKYRKIVLVALI